MKKAFAAFCLTVCLMAFTFPALGGTNPPGKGDVLPEIVLTAPVEPGQQTYLGVTGKKTFTIPEVKAEVVIIEVYSMYCPFCQAEAPLINELYEKVERNGDLKNKIKIIGIGAGNTEFEVDVFRKKYKVAFPLFSDADFFAHKALGEVRTPYFIAVKLNKDGSHQVVYSALGSIKNADKFINSITQLSGI